MVSDQKKTYVMQSRFIMILAQFLFLAGVFQYPWVIYILLRDFQKCDLRVIFVSSFATIMAAALLWGLLTMLWTPVKVTLGRHAIRLRNWLGWSTIVYLRDIGRIEVDMHSGGVFSTIYWTRWGFRRARLSHFLKDFGEVNEQIMARGKNICFISDFRDTLEKTEAARTAWDKEPDWDIINGAIARAEANRKRKEKHRE